jgi:hypothetical protein
MANKYKVPQKQWRKWKPQAQTVFNAVYFAMTRNRQELFQHPDAPKIPAAQWRTTSWNAAWIAAAAANAA